MTGDNVASIRLNISLNPLVPTQNIFNYAQLVQEHSLLVREVDEPTIVENTVYSDNLPKEEQVKVSKKKDEEDEYESDFIDDTGMDEVQEAEYQWEFGFFAWKGDLNTLFTKHADEMKLGTCNVESKAQIKAIPSNRKKKNLVESPSKNKALKGKKDTEPVKPVKIESELEIPAPKQLLDELDLLKQEAKKADFSVKKIFPVNLKPIYSKVINTALDHNYYNTKFFKLITDILPYNTFTMRKLASRTAFPERIQFLKQELEKNYTAWTSLTTIPDSKPRFTQETRIIFWNIIQMEWELAFLDNELKSLAKEPAVFTELGVRKAAFQKLSTCSNGVFELASLNNQYNQYKKKRESNFSNGHQSIQQTANGTIRVDMYSKIKPRKDSSIKRKSEELKVTESTEKKKAKVE